MMQAGADASVPVALCSSVSRTNQRRRTGTLASLAQIAAEMGVDEPILIGVGHVFGTALSDTQSAPNVSALTGT